jgi:beta-lactamase class D
MELDLAAHFKDVEEATFVLLDGATGQRTHYGQERAAMRFRPASTFKIPHTVIALETGVASGPDFKLAWDSTRVPRSGFFPASWAADQTLRSAFRNSVYWYYQELARRVGPLSMQLWLDRFAYGNREIGPAEDSFWLDGDLVISPNEQVAFLRGLVENYFGVAPRTLEVLRELALLESGEDWRLYGKTGTSDVTPTRENGWIVGWVERGERLWYYAANMEGEQVWDAWPPPRRTELALALLREVGVVPEDGG